MWYLNNYIYMAANFIVNDDIQMHIEYTREIREARHG